MFEILTRDILPVFSVLVLGFILGRMSIVSLVEAKTLNRIAFLILQPALIFPLVNGVELNEFYLGKRIYNHRIYDEVIEQWKKRDNYDKKYENLLLKYRF